MTNAKQTYDELKPVVMNEVNTARALQIIDDATYEVAINYGIEISKRIKFVEQKFLEPKAAAAQAHRTICALEKEILDPLKAVKTEMATKAGSYHALKLKAAQEEENKRLALARKAAEEAALARAVDLENAGDNDAASFVIENVPMPSAMPVQATPKVNGAKQVTRWKYRIVNTNAIPREFLMVDEQKIRKYGEAMKSEAKIAGVEFYTETTTAFGGGK